MNRCPVLLSAVLWLCLVVSTAFADELPQTRPIEWDEADLSVRLMDGAHRFVERKIDESRAKRTQYWSRDPSSPRAYIASVAANRERFKTIVGAIDPRLPPEMERYGNDMSPSLVAETSLYCVYLVRWPVIEGVWGCGLLVQPKTKPVAHVVVVPDATEIPEQLLGLEPGIPATSQVARQLAENGVEVILPVTISRADFEPDERTKASHQTYREWIYRQSFQMGRHVIGYEVQSVMAAIDWLYAQKRRRSEDRSLWL